MSVHELIKKFDLIFIRFPKMFGLYKVISHNGEWKAVWILHL